MRSEWWSSDYSGDYSGPEEPTFHLSRHQFCFNPFIPNPELIIQHRFPIRWELASQQVEGLELGLGLGLELGLGFLMFVWTSWCRVPPLPLIGPQWCDDYGIRFSGEVVKISDTMTQSQLTIQSDERFNKFPSKTFTRREAATFRLKCLLSVSCSKMEESRIPPHRMKTCCHI